MVAIHIPKRSNVSHGWKPNVCYVGLYHNLCSWSGQVYSRDDRKFLRWAAGTWYCSFESRFVGHRRRPDIYQVIRFLLVYSPCPMNLICLVSVWPDKMSQIRISIDAPQFIPSNVPKRLWPLSRIFNLKQSKTDCLFGQNSQQDPYFIFACQQTVFPTTFVLS